MAVKIPLYIFPFNRTIAYSYKRFVRKIEGLHSDRAKFRYEAVLLRAEYDKIYQEKDMRKAREMLAEKDQQCDDIFLQPPPFADSPRGPLYNQHTEYPDFVLDTWHPTEKAKYPEYFARRELRKQQYLEMWMKNNAPPKPEGH